MSFIYSDMQPFFAIGIRCKNRCFQSPFCKGAAKLMRSFHRTTVAMRRNRTWNDVRAIRRELSKLPPAIGVTIIHGAARGADRLAGNEAKRLGMEVIEFPADWARYGRAAGPIRNRQMLDEGKPDLVLAFSSTLPEHWKQSGKGTANMVKQASSRGVPVRVFSS